MDPNTRSGISLLEVCMALVVCLVIGAIVIASVSMQKADEAFPKIYAGADPHSQKECDSLKPKILAEIERLEKLSREQGTPQSLDDLAWAENSAMARCQIGKENYPSKP